MACIKKLNKAVSYNCELGTTGVAELYLINRTDISSATISATNTVSAITLASGAKTVPVDIVKNGVKVQETLKATDVSNGIDQSVTLVLYDKLTDSPQIIAALLNGSYVAAVRFKDIKAARQMVGYDCGLEISDMTTDSSANGGFTTITIKTPDDAKGEKRLTVDNAAWTTIVNAKLI